MKYFEINFIFLKKILLVEFKSIDFKKINFKINWISNNKQTNKIIIIIQFVIYLIQLKIILFNKQAGMNQDERGPGKAGCDIVDRILSLDPRLKVKKHKKKTIFYRLIYKYFVIGVGFSEARCGCVLRFVFSAHRIELFAGWSASWCWIFSIESTHFVLM